MADDPRTNLLRRIIDHELPIEPIVAALAALPYDCDDDLVSVAPGDVLRVIDRCIDGTLSIHQLTDWADLLVARDGVGFTPPHGDDVT